MATRALLPRPTPNGYEGTLIGHDADDLEQWLSHHGQTPHQIERLFSRGEWASVLGGKLHCPKDQNLYQFNTVEDAFNSHSPDYLYVFHQETWENWDVHSQYVARLQAMGLTTIES